MISSKYITVQTKFLNYANAQKECQHVGENAILLLFWPEMANLHYFWCENEKKILLWSEKSQNFKMFQSESCQNFAILRSEFLRFPFVSYITPMCDQNTLRWYKRTLITALLGWPLKQGFLGQKPSKSTMLRIKNLQIDIFRAI